MSTAQSATERRNSAASVAALGEEFSNRIGPLMSLMSTHFTRTLTGAFVGFALATGAAVAQQRMPADQVVARINGEDITRQDLDQVAQELGPQLQRIPPEQQLSVLIEVIFDIKLMARDAEAKGIDEDADVKRRLALARDSQLRAEYLRTQLFETITDERVRAAYDEEIANFTPGDERRARHILVATKDEALAIIADLDGGADFAEIATEKSTDPGSGRNGGDLGFRGRGAMVKPFDDAVFTLEAGAYTAEPVESQFGFHVIKLEEVRKEPEPTFESRQQELRLSLVRDGMGELASRLRADAELLLVAPDGQTRAIK